MNDTEDHFTFFTTCNATEISLEIPRLFRDGKHERQRVAVLVINCVLFFTTISLNGISIITIRKSSQLKSQVSYFVVLLQSVVGFGVGALGIPSFICYLISQFVDNEKCIFITVALGTLNLTCGLSMIILSTMTLERYIGVLHPYRYKTMVTKKRVLIYACGNAVILCSGTAYSFYVRSTVTIVRMTVALLNLFFSAFAYTRIYLIIRKLARSEQKPAYETAGNQNLSQEGKFFAKSDMQNLASSFLYVSLFS